LDDADAVHVRARPFCHLRCPLENLRTGTHRRLGLFWGFVSGLIAAAGNIFFYLALEAGAETAIAVPLTNVYPLVTLFLAYFWFKERLNFIQAFGIVLAVAAIVLLSGEAKNLGDPLAVLRRIGLTPWMLYSLGAMVCWGVFSATQKVSTNHVSAELSYLAWCAAFIPIALWIVATRRTDWSARRRRHCGAILAAIALAQETKRPANHEPA